MFKSEEMLLQHHENKKWHRRKTATHPEPRFLRNGDTDKRSHLKAEAEPNGLFHCETLSVTATLQPAGPGLPQPPFRAEASKKDRRELRQSEGRNGRARAPNSGTLFAVWATQPAVGFANQTLPAASAKSGGDASPSEPNNSSSQPAPPRPGRPSPGRARARCAPASFTPSCAPSFRMSSP